MKEQNKILDELKQSFLQLHDLKQKQVLHQQPKKEYFEQLERDVMQAVQHDEPVKRKPEYNKVVWLTSAVAAAAAVLLLMMLPFNPASEENLDSTAISTELSPEEIEAYIALNLHDFDMIYFEQATVENSNLKGK